MATKTKSVSKPAEVKISIPTAPVSAMDLLKNLANKAGGAKPKAKADKPVLDLTVEADAALKAWAPISELFSVFESAEENANEELKRQLMPLYISYAFKAGAPISSVRVISKNENGKEDSAALFTVQERYKVQANDVEGAIFLLTDLGMEQSDAEKLVSEEIDFQPRTAVRSFYELLEGKKVEKNFVPATDAQKAVAMKILTILQRELTPEEASLALDVSPKITVKPGFFARLMSYCATEKALTAAFTLVSPVHFPGHLKFALADSHDEKNLRLVESAKDLLEKELGAVADDED